MNKSWSLCLWGPQEWRSGGQDHLCSSWNRPTSCNQRLWEVTRHDRQSEGPSGSSDARTRACRGRTEALKEV